ALGPSKNSLFNRLSRHLRVKKRIFWHIDHLLKSGFVKVKAIVYSQTDEPYECLVNRILMGRSIKLPHLEGFGASDCMKGCKTHLLYFGTLNDVVTFVHDAYRSIGLDPKVISHEEFHIFKSEVDRSSI
ncbi:MAG: DUF123 domain-containing protein, partial [Nitrososphaerales archaeon]|nr:DUF123 domain-containing protein [Nitrososphaerales archaeon]